MQAGKLATVLQAIPEWMVSSSLHNGSLLQPIVFQITTHRCTDRWLQKSQFSRVSPWN